MLDKKHLKKILKLACETNHNNKHRACACLEGILLDRGILKPGEKFDFQDFEYERKKYILFGKIIKIKIKETYTLYIIRRTEELLETL